MHQRRRPFDNLLPAHVALIRRLLQTGWHTTRELTIETGLEKATVWFAVKTIARTQYVFARRTLLKGPRRAYRILPEAYQVRAHHPQGVRT